MHEIRIERRHWRQISDARTYGALRTPLQLLRPMHAPWAHLIGTTSSHSSLNLTAMETVTATNFITTVPILNCMQILYYKVRSSNMEVSLAGVGTHVISGSLGNNILYYSILPSSSNLLAL